jgi:hypothetical protein
MTDKHETPASKVNPDWNVIIEQAAKRGARKALAEIGLDDQAACRDVRDLRELLTNWRRIRREATRSLITFGVRAILIFMVLMAAFVISTGFGTGIGR